MTDIKEQTLKYVRSLPFVDNIELLGMKQDALRIVAGDEGFAFTPEVRSGYLDRASTRAICATAKLLRRRGRRLLLLARYITQPIGEEFQTVGVAFADLAGNVHLPLSDRYHWTVLGRPEIKLDEAIQRRPTAAGMQLLFQIAAHPESVNWVVRRLAIAAGVSKSLASKFRNQIQADDRNTPKAETPWYHQPTNLRERLVPGYADVLRPKLFLGRYRHRESDYGALLAALRTTSEKLKLKMALTGGPAAELLQRYWRGTELPLFVEGFAPTHARRLRLLPDRNGPITLLRVFGDPVFWQKRSGWWLAHPWLIYCELMAADDPRAQEAAVEMESEFLGL